MTVHCLRHAGVFATTRVKACGRNSDPFERAIAEIAEATRRLVDSLETTAPPKNRDLEAVRARERSAHRFG